MPMVQYWKTAESAQAKVTTGKDGSLVMMIDGEKEPFPGFPRGHLLFGKLSKLKHEIKNQIFNDSWKMLEDGKSPEEVMARVRKEVLPRIYQLSLQTKYDQVPIEKMCRPVKEIYRAWTKVAPGSANLRDILCLILQEDDSYRFRVQWIVTYFGWLRYFNPVKAFDRALAVLEHGEVIDDMKERQRLLRRILGTLLKDPHMKMRFEQFMREVDWNKVKLSKADKFHFRGKYFKVDLDKFEY